MERRTPFWGGDGNEVFSCLGCPVPVPLYRLQWGNEEGRKVRKEGRITPRRGTGLRSARRGRRHAPRGSGQERTRPEGCRKETGTARSTDPEDHLHRRSLPHRRRPVQG